MTAFPLLGDIMKHILFLIVGAWSLPGFAAENITVKIDSMANVKGNGSIETCGTAVHKEGLRPLLVTLTHDKSRYTTLTAANDQWCILFKRWNFSGNVDVSATTLTFTDESNHLLLPLSEKD